MTPYVSLGAPLTQVPSSVKGWVFKEQNNRAPVVSVRLGHRVREVGMMISCKTCVSKRKKKKRDKLTNVGTDLKFNYVVSIKLLEVGSMLFWF